MLILVEQVPVYIMSGIVEHNLILFFFLNDPAPTEISPLPLPPALPLSLDAAPPAAARAELVGGGRAQPPLVAARVVRVDGDEAREQLDRIGHCAQSTASRRPIASRRSKDRKSTRLNSSHSQISYAVFCL